MQLAKGAHADLGRQPEPVALAAFYLTVTAIKTCVQKPARPLYHRAH